MIVECLAETLLAEIDRKEYYAIITLRLTVDWRAGLKVVP